GVRTHRPPFGGAGRRSAGDRSGRSGHGGRGAVRVPLGATRPRSRRPPGLPPLRRDLAAALLRVTPEDGVVSVVVPARNEARRLGPTLIALLEELRLGPGVELEVVVVDDGSVDDTAATVEALTAADP